MTHVINTGRDADPDSAVQMFNKRPDVASGDNGEKNDARSVPGCMPSGPALLVARHREVDGDALLDSIPCPLRPARPEAAQGRPGFIVLRACRRTRSDLPS